MVDDLIQQLSYCKGNACCREVVIEAMSLGNTYGGCACFPQKVNTFA